MTVSLFVVCEVPVKIIKQHDQYLEVIGISELLEQLLYAVPNQQDQIKAVLEIERLQRQHHLSEIDAITYVMQPMLPEFIKTPLH